MLFRIISQGHDFRKNNFEIKIFILTASKNFAETFVTLRRTERDIITHVNMSSCKVHEICVGF